MSNTHPIFSKFKPIPCKGTGEHIFDFLGVCTNVKFKKGWDKFAVPKDKEFIAHLPQVNEHYFDWITVLESVCNADGSYRMIELGAGYGPWLVRAAAACSQLEHILNIELIGVEAEEIHYKWMKEHFSENHLNPKTYKLIYGGVAPRDGTAKFTVSDNPSENYGNALNRINESNNYVEVNTYSLESIINQLSGPVDFLHVDIQGTEYDIFPSSMSIVNEKVKSMMIGTHTSDVKHDKLVELLKENNWKIMYNYRRNTLTNTDFGDVHFNDGFLYLKNQKF